jgi:hypothetical protein
MKGLGLPGERLVLLSLLASLAGLGCAAGALGFGFLLRGVTLRISLVLLGLPFALNVVATGDGTYDFLGLTLNAFNDALDGFFWSAVVLAHMPTLPLRCVCWPVTHCAHQGLGYPQLLLPNAGAAVGDQERGRFRHLTSDINSMCRLRHASLSACCCLAEPRSRAICFGYAAGQSAISDDTSGVSTHRSTIHAEHSGYRSSSHGLAFRASWYVLSEF